MHSIISYIYTNRLKEALSQLKQDATCFYNSTTTQKRCGNKRNQLNIKYIFILINSHLNFNNLMFSHKNELVYFGFFENYV
ncbi:hypothetical protein F8172_02170 [Bacillus cereus]|uniref:Uncharacterized protein n=1 Tax=Bacillus cereus TaxID=1396 RepID=A0A9W7QK58_BACCE|nr:hypothetical protein F8172_02170 [Bacillus cereus]KAB2410642.1 hypothetical protein F8170_01470 [Bacillus cereus]KAB2431824.1 hypothetical protein F8168_02745 [Bacillus cereus]OPD53963.1 hypothetical protein BVG01_29870 [Bacillus anthracis]